MSQIMEYINKYIEEVGTINVIVDAVLLLSTLIIGIIFYFKNFKTKYVLFGLITLLVLSAITIILELRIFKFVIFAILAAIVILSIVYYVSVLRRNARTTSTNKENKNKGLTEDSKEELIEVLLKAVGHFSSRKIGAIITIEQDKSLNNFANKAVILNANTTFELLETIFHINTALHDGAVIIRGNKILCAGAFFNPSTKADIPQQYGSRHRAAIGVSEETDAFTIVVSEETGLISTTIDGTITSGISLDSLRNALEVNIKVE